MEILKFYTNSNELIDTTDILRGDTIRVVFAHVEVINSNRLSLASDAIQLTRDKYPLYFEHKDNKPTDAIGYIVPEKEPTESGEFVGFMSFYDTDEGRHARKMWNDEVFTELSVAYYLDDYEIKNNDDGEYIAVKKAKLKEISIVSVGADEETGRTNSVETEDVDVKAEDVEDVDVKVDDDEDVEVEDVEDVEADEADEADEIEILKINTLKKYALRDIL